MESYFWIMVGVVMVPMMVLAGWMDWRYHRIPNWLNVELALAGLVFQISLEGWFGIVTALIGLMTGMVLLVVPWLMHMMGPGDVKFMGAIGVWIGFKGIIESFAAGVLIGGIMGLVMILVAGRFRNAMENVSVLAIKFSSPRIAMSETGTVNRNDPKTQLIPYGVPLTLGTLAVLAFRFAGWW
jgi:prepilin peptidase CpaA